MAGQIFILGGDYRSEIVRGKVEAGDLFTDVVNIDRTSRPKRFLSLISVDGSRITHAAGATRSNRVATGQVRIRYEIIRELSPVLLPAIEMSVEPRFGREFASRIGRDRWLPDGTWKASLDVVRDSEGNGSAIDALEQWLSNTVSIPQNDRQIALTEERDALGLALQLFDNRLSKRALRATAPILDSRVATDPPFLVAMQNSSLPEDVGIVHDAAAFDGWIPQDIPVLGGTKFKSGDRSLTVANVNRTRIENLLGVDLLYFQEQYRSFVFVQYKRMTQNGTGPASYRPTGKSYQREYQRMQEWDELTRVGGSPSDLGSYRLINDAFFFKLYSNPQGPPPKDQLLKGMYFPLSYWNALIASPQIRGPKGGLVISYDNAGRYLNNTAFTHLVGNGWAGTSPLKEGTINRVIAEALEGRRSVTIAMEHYN